MVWYSQWDSNPYFADFKSAPSADWGMGIWLKGYGMCFNSRMQKIIAKCSNVKVPFSYFPHFVSDSDTIVQIELPELLHCLLRVCFKFQQKIGYGFRVHRTSGYSQSAIGLQPIVVVRHEGAYSGENDNHCKECKDSCNEFHDVMCAENKPEDDATKKKN